MSEDMREKIEAARKDELEAASFYNQLATLAPNPALSQVISSIAADEYGHYRILTTMLQDNISMGLPPWRLTTRDDFRSGLQKAIQGELSAISEYAGSAAASPTIEQQLMFISILGDEYGHVRTFITMLSLTN